jgi:hypothetical protein
MNKIGSKTIVRVMWPLKIKEQVLNNFGYARQIIYLDIGNG